MIRVIVLLILAFFTAFMPPCYAKSKGYEQNGYIQKSSPYFNRPSPYFRSNEKPNIVEKFFGSIQNVIDVILS